MNKRTTDEMIAYFNQEVSKMDIALEYKMELFGIITAIGYVIKNQDVVRCKNCKYATPNGKYGYGCTAYHYKRYETYDMKPDDFCSYAERR